MPKRYVQVPYLCSGFGDLKKKRGNLYDIHR